MSEKVRKGQELSGKARKGGKGQKGQERSERSGNVTKGHERS
jgi:hypothetical protein